MGNKSRKIRVTFDSGKVIEGNQAAQTYFDTINHIGGDVVRALNIIRAGCNIVCTDINDMKEIYREQEKKHVLDNGMYLFCHMSTEAKVNLLIDINKKTGNHFKIEYVLDAP